MQINALVAPIWAMFLDISHEHAATGTASAMTKQWIDGTSAVYPTSGARTLDLSAIGSTRVS
jgi:hypothetical protein